MLQRTCVMLIPVVITASLLSAQNTGRISGTVVSEDGGVVQHLDVCTSVKSGNGKTINCRVSVDQEGHFLIENVKFGSYGVFAINEEQGYSVENQSPGLKISVTVDNPSPNVIIRLRPRGGILTGSVTDKATGKAIDDAWINYVMIDDGGGGGHSLGINAWFSIATPTESNLLIYVQARGYKGWVYTDASNPTQATLRLVSGERKMVDIELEPVPQTSPGR
jgi:hypothetical protein